MDAAGRKLHLRLFLEKVEVPIIAVMDTAQEGAAATAQVEIIPTDRVLDFLPRTVVHVFYLDAEEMEHGGQPVTLPSGEIDIDHYYKLLFSGELFSMAYTKSGHGQRSVVLQCVDWSNYWDTTYLYLTRFGQNANFAVGNQQFFITGTSTQLFDDITDQPAQVIVSLMNQSVASPGNSEIGDSLLGGVLAILESLGGVANLFKGVNDFSTVSERRVRLMDQVGADDGRTAAAILERAEFNDFLKGRIGEGGDVLSFRDLVNLILGYIYYAVVPNPAGRYIPGTNLPLDISGAAVSSTVTGDDIVDAIVAKAKVPGSIVSPVGGTPVITSPYGYRLHPVKKKWLLHHGIDINATEQTKVRAAHVGIVTRATYTGAAGNQVIVAGDDGFTSTYDHLSEIQVLDGDVLNPGDVLGLAGGTGTLSDGRSSVVGVHLHFEVTYNGVEFDPQDFLDANALRGRAAQLIAEDLSSQEVDEDSGKPAAARERLITQIFRPDTWYVSPPLCNVLFPGEYTSLSYSRHLMREITRLQLEVSDALLADDTIINRFYFAPALLPDGKVAARPTDVDPATDATSTTQAQVSTDELLVETGIGSSNVLLFEHEKFTGIIPRNEKISRVSFDAAAAKVSVDATGTSLDAYGSRTAAFNFLRYRYAARSLEVQGRFMPRVVPGWPMLVVNRHQVVNDVAPTHFIGLVTSVTHSVNQQGGTTSISLAYARPHRPGDQEKWTLRMESTLSNKLSEVSTTVVPGASATDAGATGKVNLPLEESLAKWLSVTMGTRGPITSIADGDSALVGLKGPNGRDIVRVTFIDPTPTTVVESSQFNTLALAGLSAVDAVTKLGLTVDGFSVEDVVTTEYPFSTATFVEAGTDGDEAALEDAIRPPWISDAYTNGNIGTQVYQPLLGCAAVVDQVTLSQVQATTPNATGVSVATGADEVVRRYSSVVNTSGQAPATFAWSLTQRPVARMREVLGSFHAQASVDSPATAKLSGLDLDVPLANRLSDKDDEASKKLVDPRMDPRQERLTVVLAYAAELRAFRGLRG